MIKDVVTSINDSILVHTNYVTLVRVVILYIYIYIYISYISWNLRNGEKHRVRDKDVTGKEMQNDNIRKCRDFTKKATSTENKQGRGTRKTTFQKGNYKYE